MSDAPVPRREVVTADPRRAGRAVRYAPHTEIDEQTTLGGAYVRSLMRGQLRAGLLAFAAIAVPAAILPLVFRELPVRPGS